MKIRYIIALVLLATVSSIQAITNPVTGMPFGTSWARFESEIGKHPAKLERFVTGLQLEAIGITPASGVGEVLADPTSAKLITAMTDETGTGALVFANTPTLVTPVLGAATGTSVALGTDPADAGPVRLANDAVIGWEAAPAGTDVTIKVNSDEQFVLSAAILNAVLVTPTIGVASATSVATTAASPFLMTNGQLVTVALTSQTSGAAVLTIPDFAGVNDEFTFKTKAQTMSNKTFVAPALGVATATSVAATGLITSSGTAGIGYATGAGGTITQGTNRSTTVVLSKTAGQITTTADSMAAQTPTTFTVTNTLVAATDVIIVSKVSGDVDTFAWVNSVAAGSYTITMFNTHASVADTTALVINVVVIKGVTS